MGYYPLKDSDGPRTRQSVRLTAEQQSDAKLIADLWSAFDAALDVEREGRGWTPTSVLERLIAVGIDGFWAEVGGRPESMEDRAEFVRRAVEKLVSDRRRRK